MLGTSIVAGREALALVAATRVVLPLPVLLLPPYVMDAVKRLPGVTEATARSTVARIALEVGASRDACDDAGVVGACLALALPAAIALFPQVMEIDAQRLEPKFRNLTDDQGRPITKLWYNKGL